MIYLIGAFLIFNFMVKFLVEEWQNLFRDLEREEREEQQRLRMLERSRKKDDKIFEKFFKALDETTEEKALDIFVEEYIKHNPNDPRVIDLPEKVKYMVNKGFKIKQ